MLWYTAIVSLRDHLQSAMPGVTVGIGATLEVPDVPTIRLRVINEPEWPVSKLRFNGESLIGVDTWVRRGEVDREPYYGQLSEMQDALLAALDGWEMPSPYQIADLNVSLDADDDRFITGVGAQLTLRLNWQRTDLI